MTSVVAITHTFHPSVLISPRTFLTVIITASLPPDPSPYSSTTYPPSFLTVQLPVHKSATLPAIPVPKPRRAVFGLYTSVEHVRLIPNPDNAPASSPAARESAAEVEAAATAEAAGVEAEETPGSTGPVTAQPTVGATTTLPQTQQSGNAGKFKGTEKPAVVEWTMATTSDAGGWIPGFIQRSWKLGGVPKAIVRDVGLFLKWTARRRGQGNGGE
jgi:hypothetical protein